MTTQPTTREWASVAGGEELDTLTVGSLYPLSPHRTRLSSCQTISTFAPLLR